MPFMLINQRMYLYAGCLILEFALSAGQGAGAENVKHQFGTRRPGGRGRGDGLRRHAAAPGACCGQDGDTGQGTRAPFVICQQRSKSFKLNFNNNRSYTILMVRC